MDEHIWWYLSRAAGVVTLFASGAAVILGLLMSSRLFRTKGLPRWLADLHPFLGTITLSALAAHLGALLLDGYTDFTIPDMVLPGASGWRTGAVTWGVVAAWTLVAVQLTSKLRHRLPRRAWQAVHRASVLAFAASLVHATQAGSDVTNRVYVIAAALLALGVCFLVMLRFLDTSRVRGPVTGSRARTIS